MKKTVLDYTLKVRVPLTIFVIAISFLITFYVSRPERDGVGYDPIQPIKYSHKLHAGELGLDCQYCHTGVTKGRHALVPSVNICMNCHSVTKKINQKLLNLQSIMRAEKYYRGKGFTKYLNMHILITVYT